MFNKNMPNKYYYFQYTFTNSEVIKIYFFLSSATTASLVNRLSRNTEEAHLRNSSLKLIFQFQIFNSTVLGSPLTLQRVGPFGLTLQRARAFGLTSEMNRPFVTSWQTLPIYTGVGDIKVYRNYDWVSLLWSLKC